jgi:glycerol kinase
MPPYLYSGKQVREPVILAVDQGTSATKAIAVSASGAVIARSRQPVSQQFPRPGWAEQDPEEIWQSLIASLGDLLARSAGSWSLAGIALSTQRESAVVWDARTGQPVAPLVSWQDRRAADWCRTLAESSEGPAISDRTGLPVDPMFTAAKLRWLLDHDAGTREAARAGTLRAGTVDSWLLWRLTGGREYACDIGNASRTQLLGLETGRWDGGLHEAFGIPAGLLPEVRPSTGPFGVTRAVPGVPDGLPILAVLGDSHAALLAQAGSRPGVVKATFGTGCSLMAAIPRTARPPAGLSRTIAWQCGTSLPVFAAEGNIAAAGAAVRWAAQLLSCDEAGLARLAGTVATAAEAALEDEVILVPAFGGLGAPYWDRQARAVLVGISQATGPAQIARAAFESVAFQVADTFALIDQVLGRASELRADGGVSVHDPLMRTQADLIGRTVRRASVPEGSAAGAAFLAGMATGQWTDSDIGSLTGSGTLFQPTADEEWRERTLARWHDALARARFAPPCHEITQGIAFP